jgi:hypothetical protein
VSPDRYAGLPADLAPPAKTAQAIAALSSLAEREALFARVPPQWQAWIAHLAVTALAVRVVDTPGLAHRRAAMTEVPPGWRDDVAAHVRRLWAVAQLRAAEEARAIEVG